MLKSVYHVLSKEKEYRELGASYVNKRQEQKRKAYLKKELEKLSYAVQILKPAG